MTREGETQIKYDKVLYDRLNYFKSIEKSIPEQLARLMNNGYSNASKSNKFAYLGIVAKSGKWECIYNKEYKDKLREIKRSITLYNEKAITKFLEENNYIRINSETTYYFFRKNEILETIKNYKLCQ